MDLIKALKVTENKAINIFKNKKNIYLNFNKIKKGGF
jgi:hypothetical protein